MKIRILFLLITFTSVSVYAQTSKPDSLTYVYYKDPFGNRKKAVVAAPSQILIISGDSLYIVPDEFLLRKHLEDQKGFDVINNPDSIASFVRSRIKAVIILKNEEN